MHEHWIKEREHAVLMYMCIFNMMESSQVCLATVFDVVKAPEKNNSTFAWHLH